MRPERQRFRYETILVCPECLQSLFWGSWQEFLHAFARRARENSACDVGRIVGKLLSHARN